MRLISKSLAVSTVLLLIGCTASPSQQFKAMCEDQKINDPATYNVSAGACGVADGLSDEQKMLMVDTYHQMKKARAVVEADRQQ